MTRLMRLLARAETRRNILAVIAALFALLPATDGASAQMSYPQRLIRIVVGFPAGSAPDILARLLGETFQQAWRQPVVVESKVGAGGNIATSLVAKSGSDGYTLLMAGSGSIVTNISLYDNLPYDPVKDLTPISQIAIVPNLLVVPIGLNVGSVQELVTLARAKPDELTFAHAGLGISQHLAGELLKHQGKLSIRAVAYRGAPAIVPDLIGGQVSMCFCNVSVVLPQVRDGKLRALAITSRQRADIVAELPTMHEAGFPDFDAVGWFGLMAPAATPAAIVDTLHRRVASALAQAELRKKLEDQGMVVVGNSPSDFATLIKVETVYWAKLIKEIGLKLH